MAKAKIRCPNCGRNCAHSAATCPACGADLRARQAPKHTAHTTDDDARKSLLIRVLIVGLVFVAIFGMLGFGTENMSGGKLYSIIMLLNLNNVVILTVAKALFWLSLAAVIVSFAMLQQVMEK